MKRAALVLLLICLSPAICRADGGVVLGKWTTPDVTLFLFSKNAQLRAGQVQLEILAQDPDSGKPLLDGKVEMQIARDGLTPVAGEEWLAPCCRTKVPSGDQWEVTANIPSAGNRLFYRADTIFQKPGQYNLAMTFSAGEKIAQATTKIEIAEPTPPWQSYFPMFSLPFFAVGAFVLNRRLAGKKATF